MSSVPGGHVDPRFLTDEDFNVRITRGLRRRQPQLDIVTAQEVGILHRPDPEVLAAAREMDRILVTHDIRTMPDHFSTFLNQLAPGEHSPGVLWIAQAYPIGQAIDELEEI